MTHASAAQRDFEHQRIWRVTPDALRAATTALAAAIVRDTGSVDHVIGIANGGTAPAKLIASTLGIRAHAVHARHNSSNATYVQATGTVRVDLTPLSRALHGHRLTGRVLLVDDICGSGATLRALQRELAPLTTPSAEVLTATLCRNTGAGVVPDYSVWTVSDWVVFPWETPPAGHASEPLPIPASTTAAGSRFTQPVTAHPHRSSRSPANGDHPPCLAPHDR